MRVGHSRSWEHWLAEGTIAWFSDGPRAWTRTDAGVGRNLAERISSLLEKRRLEACASVEVHVRRLRCGQPWWRLLWLRMLYLW